LYLYLGMKKIFYLLLFLGISYSANSQTLTDTLYVEVIEGAKTDFTSTVTLTKRVKISDTLGAKVVILNETSQITSDNDIILFKSNGIGLPQLTSAQRLALISVTIGTAVFDTTINRPLFYDGANWIIY